MPKLFLDEEDIERILTWASGSLIGESRATREDLPLLQQLYSEINEPLPDEYMHTIESLERLYGNA